MFDLDVDTEYRRSDVRDRFGGQIGVGITTPASGSIIMLFSSGAGDQYGYKDGWVTPDTFHYTGQGRFGDMEFTKGNKALRDHQQNGKTLHLFTQSKKAFVIYQGEMEYSSHFQKDGVEDLKGQLRTAIIFVLKRVD